MCSGDSIQFFRYSVVSGDKAHFLPETVVWEERRLWEAGRALDLGLPGGTDDLGVYSSPESSSLPSSALEMVSAATLAVFRRGRGDDCTTDVADAMVLIYGTNVEMGFWICDCKTVCWLMWPT